MVDNNVRCHGAMMLTQQAWCEHVLIPCTAILHMLYLARDHGWRVAVEF